MKKTVKTSSGPVEIPIEYRGTRAFMAAFPARVDKVRKILPTPLLKPVLITPFTAICGIVVFRYENTTIGPYNELAVLFPVLYRPILNVPILPALLEGKLKNFGYYIWHLPVTTRIAYDAGVEIWGYPKFVGEISWEENGGFRSTLKKDGEEVLTLVVGKSARRAGLKEETLSFTTFSVKEGKLLRTVIPAQGKIRYSRWNRSGRVTFGATDLSREIESVLKSNTSLEVRIIEEMDSSLPFAEEEIPIGG